MTNSFPLGAPVPLTFEVIDSNGDLAAPGAASLTVTLPDGTTATPTLDNPETGVYVADYAAVQTGRHVARFVATGANAGADEDVFDVVPASLARVTVAHLRAYIGTSAASDEELADALAAEQAAQGARCRIDPYTADLRQALLRRVQCNIARRQLPLGMTLGDNDAGTSSYVPGQDPEVRRLEAPYRRMVVG